MAHYKVEGTDFDLSAFLAGAKQRTSHLLTLADGRMIAIRRTPMQDGGWVATHEDITEKRRADTLVVENAAKLKRINGPVRCRHQQHVAGALPVRRRQAARDFEQALSGDVPSA